MRIITTILITLFSIITTFSQKTIAEIEKYSEKILNYNSKENIWVLDTINGFTGQGSSDWEFDLTEIVKERNANGLPTLIETTEKLEGTETWVNVYRAELSYHTNGLIFEYKLQEWNTNSNSWNSELSYYEKFDEEGYKLINFVRSWDNSSQSFPSGNKEIYSYEGGLKTIKEDRDWYNNTWEEFAKTFYYYDENNNDTLELEKRFISSGNWRDNWKTYSDYNENNQKIFKQQMGYDWYWDEWIDYSKTQYSYYVGNGLIEEEFTERYDDTKSGWYDLARTDYYYNADDLLDYKEEHDLQNSDYSLKYEYTYNGDNQEETFFLYSWNGTWSLFYKVFDIYDANGNQTSFYSQTLDGTWKNLLKEEYIWNQFATSEISKISNEFEIFPNPTSNVLNIISKDYNTAKIEIFNVSGILLLNIPAYRTNNMLDISNLSPGIYFLKLSTKGKQEIVKFVKE